MLYALACLWFLVWRRQWQPHSSTLAWQIPWTEEPGRLQSMGSLGVGHDWATSFSFFTFMHWRRKWQPTQCSCLEDPRDGEPGGLPSMESHRVGHDWSDSAAAAADQLYINVFFHKNKTLKRDTVSTLFISSHLFSVRWPNSNAFLCPGASSTF